MGEEGTDAPERLLDEVAQGNPGPEYTDRDRHADFRQVFLESPQGRRVLWQILSWSRFFRLSAVFGEADRTFFHEGERNIGNKIYSTLMQEPEKRPDRVNRGKRK